MKQHRNQQKSNNCWAALLLIAALAFTSCVSRPTLSPTQEDLLFLESSYVPEQINWESISENHDIQYFQYQNSDFPIIYHIVKINLQDTNLQITAFPGNPETPKIFKSQRTHTFARKTDSIIAINASPFGGKNGKWDLAAKLGSVRQIVGIHIINGNQFSEPNPRYAAISFTKTDSGWLAQIIKSQTSQALKDCDFAFGGFYVILEDGVEQTFRTVTHDSRTALGLSEDGKNLFILVVEGEQPLKSEGLSFQQCSRVLKKLGCSDALELDGGGSTQLCINGKSVLSYPNLRYQANSFGFK